MKWEAFCRALGRRYTPELFPLDPPPENAGELANAARELLQSPVFRLAMDRVEKSLIEEWQHSRLGEREQRENLFMLHMTVGALRAELVRMTTVGRRAA